MIGRLSAAVMTIAFACSLTGPASSQTAITPMAMSPPQQSGNACDLHLTEPLAVSCQGLTYTLATVEAAHGARAGVPDPTCMNDTHDAMQRAASAAAEVGSAFSTGGPVLAAGAFLDVVGKNPELRNRIGGDAANILFGRVKQAANCVPVIVYIPKEAELVAVRLEAMDHEGGYRHEAPGWQSCIPVGCKTAWSRFDPPQPDVRDVGNQPVRLVSSTFLNWADDRTRWARMIVLYRLPPGRSVAPLG